MKWVVLILAMVVQGKANGLDPETNFKNKFAVGLDGHLRYERSLPYGFQIGTDWRYKTVMDGDRLVHFDQQPEIWLLSVSHLQDLNLLIVENRVSLIGNQYDNFSAKFDGGIRKQFRLESRWALAPFVKIIEYTFDAGAFDEKWPSRRQVHHADFETELGLELELLF